MWPRIGSIDLRHDVAGTHPQRQPTSTGSPLLPRVITHSRTSSPLPCMRTRLGLPITLRQTRRRFDPIVGKHSRTPPSAPHSASPPHSPNRSAAHLRSTEPIRADTRPDHATQAKSAPPMTQRVCAWRSTTTRRLMRLFPALPLSYGPVASKRSRRDSNPRPGAPLSCSPIGHSSWTATRRPEDLQVPDCGDEELAREWDPRLPERQDSNRDPSSPTGLPCHVLPTAHSPHPFAADPPLRRRDPRRLFCSRPYRLM